MQHPNELKLKNFTTPTPPPPPLPPQIIIINPCNETLPSNLTLPSPTEGTTTGEFIFLFILFSFLQSKTRMKQTRLFVCLFVYAVNATQDEIKEEERHNELNKENVDLGLMFASKAFVQLLANPFIGPLTHK